MLRYIHSNTVYIMVLINGVKYQTDVELAYVYIYQGNSNCKYKYSLLNSNDSHSDN